uniref:Uncharacterized protein n=1 Tax=Timema bartmani TaxID=61472 RepID=A0A7R9FCI5_9NEOP|nr:unnamed protein product [Timema bartmani]
MASGLSSSDARMWSLMKSTCEKMFINSDEKVMAKENVQHQMKVRYIIQKRSFQS